MDTRNIEGVVAVFTRDGVIRDVTSKVWDKTTIRGKVKSLEERPFLYRVGRQGDK
jgi:uncharacterized protein YjhX (UPF0386 family)